MNMLNDNVAVPKFDGNERCVKTCTSSANDTAEARDDNGVGRGSNLNGVVESTVLLGG